jgi:uncharacterized protein YjbI with pentapeptide repeats
MSLLEQAIIDAQELKEAALKSAESAILEKYSADIREAVDTMLGAEEDEEDPMAAMMGGAPEGDPMMGGMPEEEETLPEEGIPYAADAEVKLCPCPDDEEEITISFDQLQAMAGEMGEEGEQAPEEALAMAMGAPEEEEEIPMLESIDLDELLGECGEMMPTEPMEMGHSMEHDEESGDVKNITINLEEQVDELDLANLPGEDLNNTTNPEANLEGTGLEGTGLEGLTEESLAAMVREAVKYDVAGGPGGWASNGSNGAPAPVLEYELDLEEAGNISEEEDQSDKSITEKALEMRLAEAIGAKNAQIKDLKENLQTLAESSDKLKQTFMLMREQFEETNLSNAKLLYTNRTLKSTSLNERQKNRIAESIQSADTIEEAKVIFETLQSTAGGSPKSTPKSLNEAIKRPSMNMPRRRRENSQRESLVKDRFQALAGIKK